jgi:hypothetical protein
MSKGVRFLFVGRSSFFPDTAVTHLWVHLEQHVNQTAQGA